MKTLAFLSACALSWLAVTDATSGKGKTGYCTDDKDCTNTFSCVSVQTTRANVEDVKQCLPNSGQNPVCAGTQPGLCPSFSTTWGENFREISSVCAYIIPQTKAKCVAPGSTNSSRQVIECYFVQDPDDPKNATAKIGVIYGCVDFDGSRLLFKKDDKSDKIQSQLNYTATIMDKCVNPKNPSGSTFVCSSQGTCSPSSQNGITANSNDYACRCNVGFSGKYCEKIEDNKCYNDGVCGGGSCDLTTLQCTKCKAGTTGNKCANCQPGSPTVCSGHGKCVASTSTTTLGADNGGATDSGSTASSGTGASTHTVGGGGGSSSMGGNSSDTVGRVITAGYRRLADATTGTKLFQCQCDAGYSDIHCGVKVTPAKSVSATKSPAAADPKSASSAITMSLVAMGATVLATIAL